MKVAASGFSSRLRVIDLQPSVNPSATPESSGGNEGSSSPERSPESNERSDASPSEASGPGAGTYGPSGEAPSDSSGNRSDGSGPEDAPAPTSPGEAELSESEQRTLQELKRIDDRVRSHEQSHLAAAGQYARGGISLEYVTGPDGQRYAVGGSVELDTGEAATPQETIRKMQQVKQAATAPANPSPQDQQVAVEATRKLAEARSKTQESGGSEGSGETNGSTGTREGRSESSERNESAPSAGTESGGSFEQPGDIGIDVDESVGTYIADRGSSPSAESGVPSNGSPSESNGGSGLLDQFVTGTLSESSTGRSGQVFNAIA